jgi:hypothetical protein
MIIGIQEVVNQHIMASSRIKGSVVEQVLVLLGTNSHVLPSGRATGMIIAIGPRIPETNRLKNTHNIDAHVHKSGKVSVISQNLKFLWGGILH